MFIEDSPILKASFMPDGSQVILSGRRKFFYSCDLVKELIGTLKMNGMARSLPFVDGGRQLMSSGGDGQVYRWDLRTRRCIC